MIIDFKRAAYLTSAAQFQQLTNDAGREVAFIGRSNAGKSSAINAITHQKTLARTSSSPGRTQMINLFSLDDTKRLVDLPGYGFAKVPLAVKLRWQETTREYLEKRESLAGLILLMDIRHPLKDMDQEMIAWTVSAGVPLHILLTKADKLKSGAQKATLMAVQKALEMYGDALSVQTFSALKGTGLDKLRQKIVEWLT
jgi:GTP-binding protein